MRTLHRLVLAIAVSTTLGAGVARAATIGFTVTPQPFPGGNVEVALTISGLVDAGAPSLGTFDLDVVFDATVLATPTAVFGDPVLGDELDVTGAGVMAIATPGVGTINLFELSFESEADLNALQSGAFTLATLTFAPVAFGTSSLGIVINALGDAAGAAILDPTINPATVTVDVAQVPVPEPASLLLVGSGLAAALVRRRRGGTRRPAVDGRQR